MQALQLELKQPPCAHEVGACIEDGDAAIREAGTLISH